jgi:hypothetical protein
MLFKAAVSLAVGGGPLGRRVIAAFAPPVAGMCAGLMAMRALA